jgi:MFS family permease
LADRWGPRNLLTSGALVAGIGALVFAWAPTVSAANLGRFLIGGSVAVAWVVLLKLSTRWFPPRMFAFISGMALCFGVVGAVTAGVPLRLLVERYGWRMVMIVSAAVGLLLAAAIRLVVRDDPRQLGYASYAPETGGPAADQIGVWRGLLTVFRYPNTWLLSIAPAGMVGPVLSFSGLWGVPFLTSHHGLSPAQSAAVTSTMMVSWAVGGPVFGALSDRIGKRKPLYLGSSLAALAGWILLVYWHPLPTPVLAALAVGIGFFSGAMIVGFAYVKESVPAELAGTVSGVCNMGVMTGPMLLQPAIGWVLERNWEGTVTEGLRWYPLSAYRTGFTLIVVFSLTTLVLVLLSRETHCRQQVARPW